MKKLTLLVSLLLCLAMMLTFVACDSADGDKDAETTTASTDAKTDEATSEDTTEAIPEEPKTPADLIVGKWSTKLDFGNLLAMSMGDVNGQYFNDLKFEIALDMEFDKDGKAAMSVDEDAITSSFETLKNDLKVGMKKMLEDIAAAYGITVEDMAAAEGFSDIDSYLDASLAQLTVDSILGGMDVVNADGTYEIDGGNLYILTDGEEKSEDNCIVFEVDEETLKFDMPEDMKAETGDDVTMSVLLDILPIVFERQQ